MQEVYHETLPLSVLPHLTAQCTLGVCIWTACLRGLGQEPQKFLKAPSHTQQYLHTYLWLLNIFLLINFIRDNWFIVFHLG